MKKAALIFNPLAGSRRAARRVVAIEKILTEVGFEIEALPTRGPGHATDLARGAAAGGCEAVFAHGGDGTLREAAAGLVGTSVGLAPIPGGTTNVMAMALEIPQNSLRAARLLGNAEVLETDVGLCGEEIFLMQASAGLDAHIMGRLHTGLKRRFGKVAVAYSALMHFISYDYPTIELVADGRQLTASMLAVCNLPYYGGTFKMAPGASTSDRALDLVLLRSTGWRKTLAFARDLAFGRHLDRGDVERIRVEEVQLLGPGDLEIQIDGDALPMRLPVTVRLHPQTVRLLRPGTHGDAGF